MNDFVSVYSELGKYSLIATVEFAIKLKMVWKNSNDWCVAASDNEGKWIAAKHGLPLTGCMARSPNNSAQCTEYVDLSKQNKGLAWFGD